MIIRQFETSQKLINYKHMEDKSKSSKIMFYTGMAFITAAVILLLKGFMKESNFSIILGGMGIVFIGASKFGFMK